jgi:hypothetical protein
VLPPQMPGYRPSCPDRRDVARARRPVTASGTRGSAVTVSVSPDPPVVPVERRSVAAVLRELGDRVRLDPLDGSRDYARARPITRGWSADYPTVENFIGKLRCGLKLWNLSALCDPALDRRIARAETLQETRPAAAGRKPARLDREPTDRAIWLPTITPTSAPRSPPRASATTNNTAFRGTLIDQL